MSDAAIAVDLGGTNVRAALVTRDGDIRHVISRPTGAADGVEAVIDRIVSLITEVVTHERPGDDIHIGVSAPGPLNPETGIVYFATNLPGWYDVPLRAILSERTGRRVFLGNDANNAALGEVMFGAAQGTRHLLYLALGTGVGGGIVSHGRLIEGVRGLGGEVGHLPIDPSGPRCHCGGIGCVEAYAGGWAIARDGAMVARSERASILHNMAADKTITARMVAEAAQAGDAGAKGIFERAGQALAVGIGGLVNVFNPEKIVIGGGLAGAGDLLLDPLRAHLPRYTMPRIYEDASISLSALGSSTGIFGSAARVFYSEAGADNVLDR